MPTPTSQTIVALAILKTNWEELGRGYLDNFVPFVVDCVKDLESGVVALSSLQAKVGHCFGLHLPQSALRHILNRATKAGYLKREDGVFRPIPEKCKELALGDRRDRILAEYEQVARDLVQHASEEHSVAWTPEEAQERLLEFLSGRGLDVLFGKPIGEASASGRLVVASFVKKVQTSDPASFKAIETLAKGKILSDALYLTEPGKNRQKFRKTRVYLDSQLLIFLCGYAGPEREAPRRELHSLLLATGASLYCFRETMEEVYGILKASAVGLRPGNRETAYGLTVEYFLSRGMSSADVDLLAAGFPDKLRSLGIKPDDHPPFDREYQIDEAGFEQELQHELHYKRKEPLVHDVDCISAVARVRRGREAFNVETCHALFVTTNKALARVTRAYFQSEAKPGAVPLCMTDHALGNLLWVKDPTAAPDLPRLRLLADAYAAMEPPAGLWNRYLEEIQRLHEHGDVTSDEYYFLRYSITAKTTLIHLVDSENEGFSEGTVAEVLKVARENLTKDFRAKVDAEKGRREEVEKENRSLRDAGARAVENRRRLALRIGTGVARSVFALLLLVLVVAVAYTFPWSLPRFESAIVRYGITTAQIFLLIYLTMSMARGTTVHTMAARVKESVSNWAFRWLNRLSGDDSERSGTTEKTSE